MSELCGYIERITFQNSDTGYTVAHLKNSAIEPFCIVGTMPIIKPGETIRCQGEWKQHLVYGRQFIVESYKVEAPADVIGIKKYLGSGLIKGIGPNYASRIVKKFGIDTLTIIDQNPERLLEIEGLGKKRLEKIVDCWKDQKSIRDVMVFLQTYGVSPAYAQKIFRRYGDLSIKKVRENPYQLAKDIIGIGFKIADAIAQKLGIQKDSLDRLDAGIEYVLHELAGDGHVCYPSDDFVKESAEVLDIELENVQARLQELHQQQTIELSEMTHEGELQEFIWLKSFFIAENGISRHVNRLLSSPCHLRAVNTERALEWVQDKLNIKLALRQKQAITTALTEKIQIITGGPGTGKSTITKAILTITEKLTSHILLAAPTGRAAKRMSEITGRKATTIHSLLEFDFKTGKFKKGADSPLECDLIIIDEASMIDTLLMNYLLKAIPNQARVIFIGDINQLPSVGPGNILKDMISSKKIPMTMLNEIFRQAEGSRIITNAHKINSGHFPDIRNISESDFYFIEAQEPEEILHQIIALVSQRIPKKFGFHPFDEIQVLSPMKRGIIGIENLNDSLQKVLNPKENALIRLGRKFLPGDKVMQIKNNYKREVYNGDIGKLLHINLMDQQASVLFDEREVLYDFADLDELVLAYAVSVHKYQGSECPCIVIPVHTTHFKMLHRNLLYTGVTRGKSMVILVGTTKALACAVHNDEIKKRYTGLQQALAGAFNHKLI